MSYIIDRSTTQLYFPETLGRDEKRTWFQKVQAYLLQTLPGGQLVVFLMTISIEDFHPEKVMRRNNNLNTLAAVVCRPLLLCHFD